MNEVYKIDKNIPMPPKRTTKCVYPWDGMEIGDSFLMKKKMAVRDIGNLHTLSKKRGIKIAVRQEGDMGYIRVWRIA